MTSLTRCNARCSPTVMATNKGRQFVYRENLNVRAVAVAKNNRVIRNKEINASAKTFIYGRKEAVRLNAVIEANRFIETANAVTHLYVPDELGPKNKQAPTTIANNCL